MGRGGGPLIRIPLRLSGSPHLSLTLFLCFTGAALLLGLLFLTKVAVQGGDFRLLQKLPHFCQLALHSCEAFS